MAWTEDRVEVLKKLWAEGHSASQIAKQLGGVTRNAVIGKVHRLGPFGPGHAVAPCQTSTASCKAKAAPDERWRCEDKCCGQVRCAASFREERHARCLATDGAARW